MNDAGNNWFHFCVVLCRLAAFVYSAMASSGSLSRKRASLGTAAESSSTGLQVDCICASDDNGINHHTDEYESDALVIRRGQAFGLEIQLKSPYHPTDQFSIILETGKRPKVRSGTLLIASPGDEDENECFYKITRQEDLKLNVDVHIPSKTLVSQYRLSLVTSYKVNNKKQKKEFVYAKDVFILFNPWCKDDEVYMESEELKREYVLNDTGCVYWSGYRPKPWFFGQFTDTVFRCAFKLLLSKYPSQRDTAREVARHMSGQANSFDNNGLLEGNWSGDYEGGAKPWEWNGSVKICKKYLETNEPVQYGQCWVFSGLVTSLMRALGIPARSITNYDSAHDTDNNCTFDKYFDKDLKYLEDESDDSCWNFHVWNDVWMARPDLPDGLGGWQAIDGTPQEKSRGIYRCGPASLQAIKEGNVHYNYDTRFIFAEVNADQVYWKREDDDGDWIPVRLKKDKIGRFISTKTPNSTWRKDITEEYKHKENSLLERAAVHNALKKSKNPIIKDQPEDVKFSSTLPFDVSCDTGVDFVLHAKNLSDKLLDIDTVVTAQLVRYTGVTLKKLGKQMMRKQLPKNGDVDFAFHYDPVSYRDEVDENVSIRLSYMSRVIQTNQIYVSQKICDIDKPELQVSLSSTKIVKPGDEVGIKIVIPSACGIWSYSDCSIELVGPAVADDDVVFKLPTCKSDGEIIVEKTFVIKRNVKESKSLELIATFNSTQLSGITGSLNIDVIV